jgi:hypothetical protein
VNLLEVLYNVGGAVDRFGVVRVAGKVALPAKPQLGVGDEVILEVIQLNTIPLDDGNLTFALKLTFVPHLIG